MMTRCIFDDVGEWPQKGTEDAKSMGAEVNEKDANAQRGQAATKEIFKR